MRTTLDLPDPLFREVKARAAREGLKLKELLARYIEAGLSETASVPAGARGHREPLPVGIRREAGVPLHPAVSNRDLHSFLEEEDLENYRRVLGPSDTEA
ncbi:MAG: hypothetical protein ABL994_00405 [Verrucomicrobiales bacterium]